MSAERGTRPVTRGGAERPLPARGAERSMRPEGDARPPAAEGEGQGRPEDRSRDGYAKKPRGATATGRGRAAAASVEPDRGGLRGMVAVLGMFLVTLAGAGIDSYVGIGLGLVTLGALVLATAVAALTVRRRDLLSAVVAPPLIFLAVAAVNIGLAPSASFNLPTVATLLVRGFPTMAIATAVALVVALVRAAARR